MNPYIVHKPRPFSILHKPRPFAAGAPSGLVWPELADMHEKILDHAAVTETGVYTQWFSEPLGAETPHEGLEVQCRITWIFKCHRKDVEDARGKLDVTINRSLLPTQTCVWWRRLTEAEKLTCQSNLEYSETWSNVQRIILVDTNWKSYYFDFVVRDAESREAVIEAPSWAHWSESRVQNARPTWEHKLLLRHSTGPRNRPSGEQDIYYDI
jgi:hypothetical protein